MTGVPAHPRREVSYRAARQRVAQLAAALTGEQLRTPVPATPGWTVHQLLAHLVGFAADVVDGRLDGAPGDPWTARHVDERSGHAVQALLSEWERAAPTVELILARRDTAIPELVGDLISHEADLREALGLGPVERAHWQPVLEVMMRLVGRRLQHHATVLIADEHGRQWRAGSGEPVTTLRATGYELLRGAFSRRSRRQIAGWEWTPDPPPAVIDAFGYFGPRDDDQPLWPPDATPSAR